MAVKKPAPSITRYWQSFRQRGLFLIISSHILVWTVFGLSAAIACPEILSTTVFWVAASGLFVIALFINLTILKLTVKPVQELLAAIAHIAGERSAITPPNPNDKKYQKSGFGQILQTLYELSSKDSKKVVSTENDQQVVKKTKSPLATALDMTNCGFVTLDKNRKITYANTAAPISINSAGRKELSLIFNGADTITAWLDVCSERAVHAEHVWTRVPDKLPGDEGRRFFDVIASYQKGADNEVILVLLNRTDAYNIDEEDLDFIAFAAHELRGPITVIRGYIDVLQDELSDVLKDDQHELFRRLTVSANRLSSYVSNILNASRYDRRHLKVRLLEDSVAAIYDTINDDMQLRAASQNRILSVALPTDLPTVAADRASISEVFSNLIDNAIKYSNEGGSINLTAIAKGDFVEVAIEDHGIGMPGNVVSNLFKKFYRSHRSRETVAGTGIGLYISKAIVESHGGNISVRSEEGRGSTFTVSLPIYATVADKLKASDNSNEGLIEEGKGWIKNHSMFRG